MLKKISLKNRLKDKAQVKNISINIIDDIFKKINEIEGMISNNINIFNNKNIKMDDNDNALTGERLSFNHGNKENIPSKDSKKPNLKNKNKYKRKRNYNTMIKEKEIL